MGVGVIRTMAELDLELRLLELHTAVTALVREHRPDVVAIERVFTQNNKGTATGTANGTTTRPDSNCRPVRVRIVPVRILSPRRTTTADFDTRIPEQRHRLP